jgi:uncharacterized protein (TIGR03086 family)
MIDLTPACRRTSDVLANVTDDQLSAVTPCEQMPLSALVQHIGGLSLAFAAAARKDFGPLTDTPPTTGELEADWRTSFPVRLAELAKAWGDPAAWEGMSRAGGFDFPAQMGGLIALTEVVIHGWDVARATGQLYDVDAESADAVLRKVEQTAAEGPVEGLYGPAVPIADGAPVLDRIIALSGRDPAWS